MSTEQLEERVAALERAVSELQQRAAGMIGPSPTSRWWENIPPLSEEAIREQDERAPYMEYIRQTGDAPPPDWKPGDPIPEPAHWK